MTSRKKIEANRRNAQRSTGPKTRRGKRLSKVNALKYGILSTELTNSSSMSKGEKDEYKKYLRDLIIYYKPVGLIEEDLLDRYAVNQFRLRRIIRAENGELDRSAQIAQRTFFGENVTPYLDEGEKIQNSTYDSWEAVPAAKINRLAHLAAKIAEDIQSNGKVHSAMFSDLSRSLAVVNGTDEDDNENVRAVKEIMKRTTMNPTTSRPTWDTEIKSLEICVPEDAREQMVLMLKGIKDAFRANAAARMIEEIPAFRTRLLRASVPNAERLMVLMRYEAALENGRYKALHELQRIQAFRMNRNASVPVAVDVTETVSK